MSKTIKSLLFIVIGVAFASSFVANNATLDGETLNYVVNAMDSSFPVPTNLYNISVALASILNYTALLVIINVINATNKNTEITQGTLDNK